MAEMCYFYKLLIIITLIMNLIFITVAKHITLIIRCMDYAIKE